NNRIDLAELESIWLIGGIDYSESKVNNIKQLHEQGLRYDFQIPINFNFEGDYIDFYQIATKSKRFYLIAMSDKFAFDKDDDVMMFFEIAAPYSTSNLSSKLLYYSNKK
ncbi:MAG: hypothetical protein O9262_06625, partial [Cyclobacteriaceae bacterium]|nr:hypothetical protein [Cyclobacteriaceae bacterium]